VVRIFRGVLKLRNLRILGRFASAAGVLVIKEQILPAHAPQRRR
jgi:hypothetical protein